MLPDYKGIGAFVLASLCMVVLSAAEDLVGKCHSLGFDKNALLCSSCDSLNEYELGSLKNECTGCCVQDKVNEVTKKHHFARLEVCGWRLGAYPQVQAFVKSERPRAFPNLEIKYVRGADPVIHLMDENKRVEETLAIDKWNTDSVEEFLSTYLLPHDHEEIIDNSI